MIEPKSDGEQSDLRARLIALIADQTGVSSARLTDDVALAEDLGLAGHDGADLLEAIGREFGVDFSAVDWAEYFGGETPWDPLRALWVAFFRAAGDGPPNEPKPLRISDLLRSIEQGRWSAPE